MSRAGTAPRRPNVGARRVADFICAEYRRQVVEKVGSYRAQVLTLPPSSPCVRMRVHADQTALGVDFRRTVVRRDLTEGADRDYLERPGFRISDELSRYRRDERSAVILNGNNIGYWGNQFVIENGELVAKRKGPLFDDGNQLRAHATGEYAFFMNRDGRFRIASLGLTVRDAEVADSDVRFDVQPGINLPSFGLSGFPILRRSKLVWRDHAPFVWDPALLYDHLGPLSGVGYQYGSIRQFVSDMLDDGEPLARHPMTALGVDDCGAVVLLVAERGPGSQGMTVEEVAHVLQDRYGIVDAIVLGAAGDAQLATTREGFLVAPWVSRYSEASARTVPHSSLHPALRGRPVSARPVPSYIAFEFGPRWVGRPRHAVAR